MKFRYLKAVILLAVGLASVPPSFANQTETTNAPPAKKSMKDMITDSEDGKFDVSEWLTTAQGFLPVISVLTEPATGYGAAAALLFLHDSIENRAQQMKEKNPNGSPKRLPPPSVSGVFGLATENGTWGAGLFHLGVWKEDTFRYLGALVYNSANLDFYPLGQAVPFNIESAGLFQQLTYRLGESDFFLGGNYAFTSTTATPKGNGPIPPLLGEGVEIQSGGAGVIFEYDSRDNLFSPNRGFNPRMVWAHYNEWLGSDNQFDLLSLTTRYWHPLTESLVLGLRADGFFSGGDIPFYMKPFVPLRGIPAMRYQGDYVLTTEAELRWDFTPRWSLIGFAGAGWTANDSLSNFGNSDTYPAAGFGVRYLVARIFDLRSGIDVGFSEEDSAIYFVTGSAWGL